MSLFEALIWLEDVDSTQEVLKKGNFESGTVVVANRQKKGKGRKGRRWESQEGGLYFSFVLSEEIFRNIMGFPLAVALGVKRFLSSQGFSPAIKWPNDVYVEGKKCCGVLVERTGGWLISGVGLNVNQEEFRHIGEVAVSMRMVSGEIYDRRDVLIGILKEISEVLEGFAKEGFGSFADEVESCLLFRGQEVVVTDGQSALAGILEGIDGEGGLLLETGNGRKRILAGDVSLRPVV